MELNEIEVKYNPVKTGEKIIKSQNAYIQLKKLYSCINLFEEFYIILLNRRNEILGFRKISQGGISGTIVDIKIIFGIALKCAASSIIISHNHPSGNLKPSELDIKTTEKIKQGCVILDLKLLDHIIVTENSYYSFADEFQI